MGNSDQEKFTKQKFCQQFWGNHNHQPPSKKKKNKNDYGHKSQVFEKDTLKKNEQCALESLKGGGRGHREHQHLTQDMKN